jgi:Holliday junction resolvasome RuvABC DNA-binding subunit
MKKRRSKLIITTSSQPDAEQQKRALLILLGYSEAEINEIVQQEPKEAMEVEPERRVSEEEQS